MATGVAFNRMGAEYQKITCCMHELSIGGYHCLHVVHSTFVQTSGNIQALYGYNFADTAV
jgi:hypothetical protein